MATLHPSGMYLCGTRTRTFRRSQRRGVRFCASLKPNARRRSIHAAPTGMKRHHSRQLHRAASLPRSLRVLSGRGTKLLPFRCPGGARQLQAGSLRPRATARRLHGQRPRPAMARRVRWFRNGSTNQRVNYGGDEGCTDCEPARAHRPVRAAHRRRHLRSDVRAAGLSLRRQVAFQRSD